MHVVFYTKLSEYIRFLKEQKTTFILQERFTDTDAALSKLIFYLKQPELRQFSVILVQFKELRCALYAEQYLRRHGFCADISFLTTAAAVNSRKKKT